jgi:(p)ppGpp synthase/HD superfamily hydrolase
MDNTKNISRLCHAIHFSAIKHRNQRRKNEEKTPYINHPIDVMNILASHGITDVNILIAGIGHDLIEDTNCTETELRDLFGDKVCSIVLECTDDKKKDKITRKKLQLEHSKDISYEAKCVKLADKYSNLFDLATTPPSFWSQEEIVGYTYWSYAIFLHMKGTIPSLDEKFMELFNSLGVKEDDDVDQKLENYYKNIKNSE